jgi:hypothetical protein
MSMLKRATMVSLLLLPLALAPARAQQSTSYKVTEWTMNEGGHPAPAGAVLASTSYRIRLDAVGDGVRSALLASTSYRADGGLVAGYRAPVEVQGFVFADRRFMSWTPDPASGTYNVYRALTSTLPALGFGTCFASALTTTATLDTTRPTAGNSYFYLVTAKNRLLEEGTKGYLTSGVERANAAPCP